MLNVKALNVIKFNKISSWSMWDVGNACCWNFCKRRCDL